MRALAMIPLVLLLSGCVGSSPPDAASPTPTATPVFASEEDALAAAEAAYARYLEVSDAIFQRGGLNADELSEVATGPFLAASLQGFANVSSKAWRSIGTTTLRSVLLQSFESSGRVVVYACEDVSGVDVVDARGTSVVAPTRPDTTTFQTTFTWTGELLVSSHEAWSNEPC